MDNQSTPSHTGLKRNVNTSAVLLVWNVLVAGLYLVSHSIVAGLAENAEGLGGVILVGGLGGIDLVIAMIMVASCFVGILMGIKRMIAQRNSTPTVILNLLLTLVSVGGFLTFYFDYL